MADQMRFGTRPQVTIDGQPLRSDLDACVERVVVDTSVHLPDMVELVLRDDARDVFRRAGVRIGSALVVSATASGDGRQHELVHAEVTALGHDFGEHGTHAVIRGYDTSHRLTRGRRTASYNDVTDADVVRQVAQRAGLEAGNIDGDGPTYDHVAQVNATDWDFLCARARETGREVLVTEGALHWRKPRSAGDAPPPALDVSTPPQPLQLVLGGNLLRFRPRVTAAAQVVEVQVRSWDPGAKQAVVGRADASTASARVGLEPAAIAATFGAPAYVSCDRPVATQAEADAVAAAFAETLASAHAEADGVAVGDPPLVAGAAVSVGCAGWPYDGVYTLTTARHVYDAGGYRVEFTVSGRQDRSLLGLTSNGATNAVHRAGGPPVHGVVIGLVTNVDDPDELGRVKLRFPWLADDYESWWARVAQLGAGPQRGAVWLPEVGDEVLVAFEHGDTRRPYVISGLYNGVDAPRLGDGLVDVATGAVKRRGFVSKQGHRLVFLDDDGKSGIALVSANDGLRIALKQTDTTIRIASDGSVQIEGSREVLVKSDGSISLEAGTTLTLKGGSGVKVDGGPQVEVTGGVVKLN